MRNYVLFGAIANKEESKGIIDDIIGVFEERCAGFQKYSEAIEKTEVFVYTENSKSVVVKVYGWNIDVLIRIAIKRNAKLPKSLASCAGTNLLYIVGGGHNSGIQILGRDAALFFGLKKGRFVSGEKTFISDKVFKLVDEISTT